MKDTIEISLEDADGNSFSGIASILEPIENIDGLNCCQKCKKHIEELKLKKRNLEIQLIEQSYHADKTENKCKCKLKEDLDLIQIEEQCLLETIDLKKQRIEHLKEIDLKLENNIQTEKENVNNKKSTQNDIQKLLNNCEETYNDNCENIKQKQKLNNELEKNISKLKKDIKGLEEKMKIDKQKFDKENNEYKEITKSTEVIRDKINKQKKTLIELDMVTLDYQNRINNLKDDIKMLTESQKFHEEEVAARTERLAIISEEKQKYTDLSQKLELELISIKNIYKNQENLKQENKKLYNDLKNETQELQKLLENEKKTQINLKQKLKDTKSINDNLRFEIKTDEDNCNRIKIVIDNLKIKRSNANDALLDILIEDKEKIRQLLDECSKLESLIKDSMSVKNVLDKNNYILEAHLVDGNTLKNKDNNVSMNELKTQLAKHHEQIEQLKNRFEGLINVDRHIMTSTPIVKHQNSKPATESLNTSNNTKLDFECSLGCHNEKDFSCTLSDTNFLE